VGCSGSHGVSCRVASHSCPQSQCSAVGFRVGAAMHRCVDWEAENGQINQTTWSMVSLSGRRSIFPMRQHFAAAVRHFSSGEVGSWGARGARGVLWWWS